MKKEDIKRLVDVAFAGFDPNQKRNKDGTWGDDGNKNNGKEFTKDSKVKKKLYHITTENFDEFDPKKGAQGVIWLTENKGSILSNETGASLYPGKKRYLLEVFVKIKKMAGWDEYDKYSFGELIQLGFDGIKLDDDYVIFNGNQALIVNKSVQ